MVDRFTRFQEKLLSHSELANSLLPDIVEAVRAMLKSEDMKTVMQGISIWENLQAKTFANTAEGFRISREERQAIMAHVAVMRGGGTNGSGTLEDPYAMALASEAG